MWIITIIILLTIAAILTIVLPDFGYPSADIIPNLLISLISGGIIFILGLNWDKVRSLAGLDFYWVRCVFGKKAVEKGKINITLDTYRDIRLFPKEIQTRYASIVVPQNTNRFIKTFPDGHTTAIAGAFEWLMGYCSARGSSYLIERLSSYFKKGVAALSDEEAAAKWEGSFINLGSSASNVKTDNIKHHNANTLFQEDFNSAIELKDGQVFRMDDKHDIGMILKIKNPYFKNYSLIICEGIGEYGTSGAAWYLSRHWRKLGFKYLDSDFVVIVKVLIGSDESAIEIYSSESWLKKIMNKIRKAK